MEQVRGNAEHNTCNARYAYVCVFAPVRVPACDLNRFGHRLVGVDRTLHARFMCTDLAHAPSSVNQVQRHVRRYDFQHNGARTAA